MKGQEREVKDWRNAYKNNTRRQEVEPENKDKWEIEGEKNKLRARERLSKRGRRKTSGTQTRPERSGGLRGEEKRASERV